MAVIQRMLHRRIPAKAAPADLDSIGWQKRLKPFEWRPVEATKTHQWWLANILAFSIRNFFFQFVLRLHLLLVSQRLFTHTHATLNSLSQLHTLTLFHSFFLLCAFYFAFFESCCLLFVFIPFDFYIMLLLFVSKIKPQTYFPTHLLLLWSI